VHEVVPSFFAAAPSQQSLTPYGICNPADADDARFGHCRPDHSQRLDRDRAIGIKVPRPQLIFAFYKRDQAHR
jgi:hypothetical protein